MDNFFSKQARFVQLDILKLILIVSVLIIHSNTCLHLKLDKAVPFVYFIQLAVPMFMVISGYTFSLSYSRVENARDYYAPKRIVHKIVRFSIPMVFTDIVYLLARIISGNTENTIIPAITFNFGPGAYYFFLVIELILVFPLVYKIFTAWGGYGIIACIIINLVSEIISSYVNMPAYLYARNIFEYFACIGFGCWIFHMMKFKKFKKQIWLYLFSAIVGIVWITVTQYGVIQNSLFSRNLAYGLPVSFYVWIIVLVVAGIKIEGNHKVIHIFAELGRASFHILCVQMIWFPSLNALREKLPFTLHSFYFMPISIVLCVMAGYVFYRLDDVIQKRLRYN